MFHKCKVITNIENKLLNYVLFVGSVYPLRHRRCKMYSSTSIQIVGIHVLRTAQAKILDRKHFTEDIYQTMILKINVFTGIDRRFHSWQTSLRDIIFYCYSPILFTPEFQDCRIIHSGNDDRCFWLEETLTFDVCVLASFSRSTIVAVCSHVEDLLHLLIYCFHFLADSLVNISDA